MTSTIAWLDTSADEQRRVRELIALFSETDTLDELGLGQIRDIFSNAMFPGLTVIQTRARYFLLVPWGFLEAGGSGRAGASLRAHADRSQRILVETLRGMPGQVGVIGAIAGASVKNLPSTIYWNGLRTFGILRRDTTPDGLLGAGSVSEGADELASRVLGDWHPTIPPAPAGFPYSLENGLDLIHSEAAWLRERILDSVPGTVLAHLVAGDHAPDGSSPYPWRDGACAHMSGPAAEVLGHAHLFSLAMRGATLLYSVLVARAYENEKFNAVRASPQDHETAYRDWVHAVEEERHLVDAWDTDAFWRLVRGRNPGVSLLTERFVRTWVDLVVDGTSSRALDEVATQQLVTERERAIKRAQARLVNKKTLALWRGGVGGGGLNYRWPLAKRIITDIHEGLSRA